MNWNSLGPRALEEKLEELEKRIRELEARPMYVPVPVYYPLYTPPPIPYGNGIPPCVRYSVVYSTNE